MGVGSVSMGEGSAAGKAGSGRGKVGFAVIGCGRIAPRHFEAIKNLEDAQLVAVIDVIEERAIKAAGQNGCDWYSDFHEVLRRPDVNVVNICTPSGLHAQIGIEAAKAGKHVVVEKPMALSLTDADRLIAACQDAGVKLFVVHQNRFNTAIRKLRAAVEAGKFGKFTHANATIRWHRDQAYYDSAAWRGTWAMDGGVLMNQSIHNIDLLQWMMGPVESVFAYTATRLRRIQAEDVATAVLRFRNGALGVIEASSTIYPKNLEETLSIFGETGTVVVGGVAVNRIQTWRFADLAESEEAVLTAQETDPPSVYGFGHLAYMKNVLDSIITGHSPAVDGPEGRKALEIILGIYASVRSGQRVTFPLHETWRSLEELMQNE